VRITWPDGMSDAFHHLWLRDNCPCAECRDPAAGERLFDTVSMPVDLRPRAVRLEDALVVDWHDGHRSRFPAAWLRRHAYGATATSTPLPTWDAATIAADPPHISLAEIDAGRGGQLRWLQLLRDHGFCIVSGVPTRPEAVVELAERIAFVQESNFGRTFEVVSKPDPNNLAYTPHRLYSHTDIPNRHSAVNLQLLHCIENAASGGESILVDGFEAARRLRHADPDAFEVLRAIEVPWRFRDDDTEIVNRFPVIGTDGRGEVTGIRLNTGIMAPLDVAAELVVPFYAALRRFGAILRDPELEHRFRMAPGDCQIFDNQRVLHARAAFDPSTGRRHLQGCYVDKDDAMGRLRTLERALRVRPAAVA
jgi:gamma-butyrobetaine dioxygenase